MKATEKKKDIENKRDIENIQVMWWMINIVTRHVEVIVF